MNSVNNIIAIELMLKPEPDTMSGKTVIKGNPSQYVKLNVGGCLHYTTIGTLTKHDTMLRAMFSGRMEVLSDSDGIIYNLQVLAKGLF